MQHLLTVHPSRLSEDSLRQRLLSDRYLTDVVHISQADFKKSVFLMHINILCIFWVGCDFASFYKLTTLNTSHNIKVVCCQLLGSYSRGDRQKSKDHWWNYTTSGEPQYSEKNLSLFHSAHHKPQTERPGLNLGLCSEKPKTNHLSHRLNPGPYSDKQTTNRLSHSVIQHQVPLYLNCTFIYQLRWINCTVSQLHNTTWTGVSMLHSVCPIVLLIFPFSRKNPTNVANVPSPSQLLEISKHTCTSTVGHGPTVATSAAEGSASRQIYATTFFYTQVR